MSPREGEALKEQLSCKLINGEKKTGTYGRLVFSFIVIAVIVLAAHWPALVSKTLSFDDEQYLLDNQLVKNPGWRSVGRFLSEVLYPSTVRGYYQPLSMISLMMDCAAGGSGDNLLPFRITSLTLHIANTILIIVLLYQFFGQVWAACMVGLLFGVHPLTVEPIPWLAERKTLLAAFFALWSLIFYVRFSRNRTAGNYFICMAFFVLSLMSKPTTVPLPVLMLLLDYWPLKRFNGKAIVEKIPLLAVSVISAIVTFLSQRNTAVVTMPGEYGHEQIPLMICHNIIFYLYKFVWPVHLSAFYPFPKPFDFSNTVLLVSIIGTIVLIAVLAVSLRWTKALAVGWLFFFFAVFPTLGIIGFHPVIAADRHVYLPMLGFLLPVTAFLSTLLKSAASNIYRRYGTAIMITALLCAGEIIAVRHYLVNWKDTVTHYEHMLLLSPDYPALHNNLALALDKLGKTDEAIGHYRKSLEIEDNSYEVHNNLGMALLEKGRIDEAIEHYQKAIRLTEGRRLRRNSQPGFAEAHYNLANMLGKLGHSDQAVEHYKKALVIKPDDIDALNNMGGELEKLGRTKEAVECYEEAIKIKPNDIIAHGKLALVLAGLDRIDEAIKQIRIVLAMSPRDAEMHRNLGILLERQGKATEAIKEYQQVLKIDPNDTKTHRLLEAALRGQKSRPANDR
jgi:tetratricopeptide (TPR) repeat protein